MKDLPAFLKEKKYKGIKFGCKRKINRDELIKLKRQGIGATEIVKRLSISRAAVYKILKEEYAIMSERK